MENWLLLLVLLAPIASLIGWLFWIGIIALAAKAALDGNAMSSRGGGDFETLLTQIDRALRAATPQRPGTGGFDGTNLSPQQQLQLQNMMMKAQSQMAQMDALSRERYDTRVADLTSMAASAGIDWRP
jgi:hypothetical protein